MHATLKRLYGPTMGNTPPEVILFVQALSEAYPQRCVGTTETMAEAQRYAGLSTKINDAMKALERSPDVSVVPSNSNHNQNY